MRSRYFVTYDIADDARRTAVFKALCARGDHLQYSVFSCDLTDAGRVSLIAALHPLIDHVEDQILLIDVGPVDGRAADSVESLGRRYQPPERTVVIV